jgi:hypothetical protein
MRVQTGERKLIGQSVSEKEGPNRRAKMNKQSISEKEGPNRRAKINKTICV